MATKRRRVRAARKKRGSEANEGVRLRPLDFLPRITPKGLKILDLRALPPALEKLGITPEKMNAAIIAALEKMPTPKEGGSA